jgi:NAD(P)-dependent dehydrogenase (short-subunit alcohol dehydrogenase family)
MTSRSTVLITGATRGLGAQTAARLAERGWTVGLDVTSDESVSAAHDAVRAAGTGLDGFTGTQTVTEGPSRSSRRASPTSCPVRSSAGAVRCPGEPGEPVGGRA